MASKPHMVMCRVCKQRFDIAPDVDGETWIRPSKNQYYHRKCYDDFLQKREDIHAKASDEEWMNITWMYLTKDLKAPVEYVKFQSQWKNFLKKTSYSGKGIYYALRYFYDIQHGDVSKCEGGIGIINYIYNEGCGYWVNREKHDAGIVARIEEQARQAANREHILVKQVKRNTTKKSINLASIAEMEDEE